VKKGRVDDPLHLQQNARLTLDAELIQGGLTRPTVALALAPYAAKSVRNNKWKLSYNLGRTGTAVHPDRLGQIEELYHAARELEPSQRSAFMAGACRGDEALRREVESLLAQDPAREGMLDRPPAAGLLNDSSRAPLAPGARLGPYQILAPIGKGGMGEVWKARDTRLGRDVAIKISIAQFTERFEREARAIAALNHPNICTLYDVGPDYLVMELVEGETLSERLGGEALPLEEALRICRQIADALGAAHQKRITHRDLKPANLKILPDGRVKVLDFGLAKSFGGERSGNEPSDSPTITAITRPGVILGTPAYMSPQQIRGDPVDSPADIWAFGCVLYELLTGQRAFSGVHVTDIIASVLKTEPDWAALPSTTPPRIRDLLRDCLQKETNRRCPDISRVRLELEEIGHARLPAKSAEPDQTIHSLAVLPFANISGDPQMEYLSDGLTESIILSLSQLPQLKVMSRSAVFRFKGKTDQAQDAGQALAVGAVLTGKVTQRGSTLLITAELVDVAKGWQLWGAQYKKKAEDIFALEDDIAKEISEKLRLKLAPEKQNLLVRRYTENVDAYHLYLKGRFYWAKRTEEGLFKGIQFFRQAIELDPTYALAYAGLAEGYVPLAVYCHLAPTDAMLKAKAAAQRALEIDPELVEARTVLGAVKSYYDWNFAGGEEELRAAVELDPKYARARQTLAETLTITRRFAEAAVETKRALDLDPLALSLNAFMSMTHYFDRQYDKAIEYGCKTVEMDPNFFPAYFYLGMAYQLNRQFSEAAAALQQARLLSNHSGLMVACLGGIFASWGKQEEARKILRELEEMGRRKYVSQVFVSAIFAGLGERDEALARLERAYDERCTWLPRSLAADARFDSLRVEARFQDLTRRVGIPFVTL